MYQDAITMTINEPLVPNANNHKSDQRIPCVTKSVSHLAVTNMYLPARHHYLWLKEFLVITTLYNITYGVSK